MAEQAKPTCREQLAEIRKLMAEFSHECEYETHTYRGKELIIVDEDGKPVESGGGYFAWADGERFTEETRPTDWPKGHRAIPCGKCNACRLSALGCGTLSIHDGRGHRDVSLAVRLGA
ncbi:MAG TPA: hypothetical protein VGU71_22420 [Candidatus Dormibacteraeota bacterium]|nr:hypothetical protein [Candidatus Dormibacteraeota bacterium]